MVNILQLITLISIIIAIVFLLLAVFNFIKLDRIKALKMLKLTAIPLIIIIFCSIAYVDISPKSQANKSDVAITYEEKPVAKVESAEDATWQTKVKEVASLNSTPSKKFDTIEAYAKKYPATKAEIKEFEDYMKAEYKNKKYLADVQNNKYMLENIFKAYVVNRYYGEEETPINDFVFGFYQNSNYTFKGLKSTNSHAIKYNERQMDKAIAAIEH
ncbi:hypothetical protein LAV73_23460 [Lysinibacillus xylanilyticus]|uniref:hypothetical protein n=1 Tax=Lysinibacillus xylanilyticus TaxID=582475 RepID=UPI002B24B824|nr:hypothetical protein [Lysinibacillus xylanilyticus]MEB2282879.1 hypothetical protein [Lysinibacillus xylanilyticus]